MSLVTVFNQLHCLSNLHAFFSDLSITSFRIICHLPLVLISPVLAINVAFIWAKCSYKFLSKYLWMCEVVVFSKSIFMLCVFVLRKMKCKWHMVQFCWHQKGHVARKTLHQLLPSVYPHSSPPAFPFSCLRRTWWKRRRMCAWTRSSPFLGL